MLNLEKDYKRLVARRDLLKLIFDIHCYDHIKQEKKDSRLRGGSASTLLLLYMDFVSRLREIIANAEKGLLNLNDTDDVALRLYQDVSCLYGSNLENNARLNKIENEILYIELACPNRRKPCIELMEFTSSLEENFKEKKEAIRLVGRLLTLLNHEQSCEEREYITNKCAIPEWYTAFFVDNPTADDNDHGKNLEDLLESTLIDENPNREPTIKRAIYICSKAKHTGIKPSLIKKLICNCINNSSDRSNDALKSLGASSLEFSFTPDILLNEVLKEMIPLDIDRNLAQFRIRKIFGSFTCLLPMSVCLETFAYVLSSHPIGDDLADSIESYLSYTIGDTTSADVFSESYLTHNQEYQERKPYAIHPNTTT